MRTNADPGDSTVNAIGDRLCPFTSDSDDCIESPASHATHAPMNAEAPRGIRVAGVSAFVNKSSHQVAEAICGRDKYSMGGDVGITLLRVHPIIEINKS